MGQEDTKAGGDNPAGLFNIAAGGERDAQALRDQQRPSGAADDGESNE
jgi:hypothetical protein